MKKKKETITNDILLALLKQGGYEYKDFGPGLYGVAYMGKRFAIYVHEDRHSVTLKDVRWCFDDENDHESLDEIKRIVNEMNMRGISKLILEKNGGDVLVSTMLTISLVNDIPQLGDYLNNRFKVLLLHRGALTRIDYDQFDMEPVIVDYKVAPLVSDALQCLACDPDLYSDDWKEDIWFYYENEYMMARIDGNHPVARIVYPNWYKFPLADSDLFAVVCKIVNDINVKQENMTLFWQIDEQNQEVMISSVDRFFVTENREETISSIKQIVPDLISAKLLFELILELSQEDESEA